MQDWPLRVMRLVDHAEREHGNGEIVSAWADGSVTRTNWREVAHDARRMAQALEAWGIEPGDRVAAMAFGPGLTAETALLTVAGDRHAR